jgi:putative membrane protein
MKLKRARIIQIISILVIQGLVLIALQALLPGLRITSFWSALGAALGYSIAQAVFWYVFIEFLSWLPEILYPFFTFVLSRVAVFLVDNLVPGITIDTWVTGLWITIWMTVANAILGGLLSLDEDNTFDRRVTRRMVKKLGSI